MYCKNCGAEIDDNAVVCPKCGVAQTTVPTQQPVTDNGGFGWGLLGFCIPIVGLILYLVWHDSKPITANSVGKGALISVIVSVACYVLFAVLGIGAGVLGGLM